MSIRENIIHTRALLARAKHRSRRRVELETRLRDLVLKQLKQENRKKL